MNSKKHLKQSKKMVIDLTMPLQAKRGLTTSFKPQWTI
jgi:hypothetical protein